MFRPGSAPPRAKDVAAVRAEIETLRRAAEEDALGPQMKAEALFKMLSQLKSENAALKARPESNTSKPHTLPLPPYRPPISPCARALRRRGASRRPPARRRRR